MGAKPVDRSVARRTVGPGGEPSRVAVGFKTQQGNNHHDRNPLTMAAIRQVRSLGHGRAGRRGQAARSLEDDSMNVQSCDLIVLGGGPAGKKGAAQAAYCGKRVALVERARALGGAVANTSIPFKALRETAQWLAGFRTRKLRGGDPQMKERATLRDSSAGAEPNLFDPCLLRLRAALSNPRLSLCLLTN
jgi:hypothetical protein